jgi:thioredoxin-related protein
MKRLLLIFIVLTMFGIMAMKNNNCDKMTAPGSTLTWYTWQQAVELNKKAPRKLLVDVYTDWCGWCKVMDRETFANDTIANYLNRYFYCVKFNAEGHEPLQFNGTTFSWISPEKGGGRNGIHEFAYGLLNGNLSYPSIVYLNEKYERIVISPGFKKPAELLTELRFSAEEIYSKKTWQEYLKEKKP